MLQDLGVLAIMGGGDISHAVEKKTVRFPMHYFCFLFSLYTVLRDACFLAGRWLIRTGIWNVSFEFNTFGVTFFGEALLCDCSVLLVAESMFRFLPSWESSPTFDCSLLFLTGKTTFVRVNSSCEWLMDFGNGTKSWCEVFSHDWSTGCLKKKATT